jgi:hypothetical protein
VFTIPAAIASIPAMLDSAHEVLCHELVHAFRSGVGTIHQRTKRAETLAIMITNIFASETNKPALRKDHDGHDPQKIRH